MTSGVANRSADCFSVIASEAKQSRYRGVCFYGSSQRRANIAGAANYAGKRLALLIASLRSQ